MAVEKRPAGQLLAHGIVGGIAAGIAFMIALMVMSLLKGGSFFAPLQLISSIVLGGGALSPSYPLATSVVVGLIVHLLLSAFYGVVFVYLLNYADMLGESAGLLVFYGGIYGLALWNLNFILVGAVAFPQFTVFDHLWMGFIAHTFVYGLVLGGYVAAVRPGGIAEQTRSQRASGP